MLVLGRKSGEKAFIRLGGHMVEVMVCGIEENRVRLGFTAPPEVEIHREEVYRRMHGEPDEPSSGGTE